MIEKIDIPNKRSGDTFNATELNQIVTGLNNNSETLQAQILELESDTSLVLGTKADKVNGTVPLTQLPSVYFSGVSGSGTETDPYVVTGGSTGGQASAEDYLKSLPGYSVDKILYSDLTWGPIPVGGDLEKIETPVLSKGTATVNGIPLSWNLVFGATTYKLERSLDILFSVATTVYSGSAASFTDTGLTANTQYYYRLKAGGAGYASSNFATLTAKTAEQGNITPPSPTAGLVDDNSNTFNWTNATGFSNISDYQYTLDGGVTVIQANVKPLSIGNVNVASGKVGIRVSAATGRDASSWLFNTTPYTMTNVTPPAPTAGLVNNTADTFDWTYASGYTNVTDYEFTTNGGTTYAPATEKPLIIGDVSLAIGKVGVRVKAATGRNNSSTLYNTVAFTAAPMATRALTDWYGVEFGTAVDVNSFKFDTVGTGGFGFAFASKKLASGAEGFIQMDVPASGFTTADMALIVGRDVEGNHGDAGMHVWVQAGGAVVTRLSGEWGSNANIARGANSKIRIRCTADQIFVETSTNGGETWTIIRTDVRPSGDLQPRLRGEYDTNNSFANNVREGGLTAW